MRLGYAKVKFPVNINSLQLPARRTPDRREQGVGDSNPLTPTILTLQAGLLRTFFGRSDGQPGTVQRAHKRPPALGAFPAVSGNGPSLLCLCVTHWCSIASLNRIILGSVSKYSVPKGSPPVAELKTDALIKSLEGLVAEKESVTSREKELVDRLNAVLSRMGYRVMPAGGAVVKRRGRPPGRKSRRPGRPKGSGNGRRRRRGPGRPPKAASSSKRRGGPPKEKKTE
jgi:hypothetical protein